MKYQPTSLNRNLINLIKRLDSWAANPWRRYSLLIIIFLSAFLIGSSIGMINGVLALMDPIGASNTWRWHGYKNSWIVLDGLNVQSVSGGGHWGGGMFINALDHARFGYLFLRLI